MDGHDYFCTCAIINMIRLVIIKEMIKPSYSGVLQAEELLKPTGWFRAKNYNLRKSELVHFLISRLKAYELL